jgi:PAS domain S-box-containing protein
MRGVPAAFAEFRSRNPPDYGPGTGPARMLRGERVLQHLDLMGEDIYRNGEPNRRALVDLGGARSSLQVALVKDESFLGFITLFRQEVRPFSDKQVALLQNFGAQAVIAMENARLLTEQREALEQQTATAEVLRVINSSPGDLAPVFQTILDKAHALCGVAYGSLQLYDGERLHAVAVHGLTEALAIRLKEGYVPGADHPIRRLLKGEDFVHSHDIAEIDDPGMRAAVELGGIRTRLAVALRKDSVLLGQIVAGRQEVRPFTDKEIALMQSFATQAVIAIENARLINETREALEQQTATAEVLQVINSSPGDLAPVLDAMLEKATSLCGAAFGILWLCDGERFHAAALHGVPERYAEIARVPCRPHPGNPLGRMLRGERVITSLDAAADEPYRAGDPVRRALVDLGGARSFIQVALVKDDVLLGSLTVYRQEVRRFSEKQIALLQSFAAQAVIAIENARLINETREALEQQTATANVLQVINSSPGDLSPVFDAILEKAMVLCQAAFGYLNVYDGQRFHPAAARGVPAAYDDYHRTNPAHYGPATGPARIIAGEAYVHTIDAAAGEAYKAGDPSRRALVDIGGARTLLVVALRRDDVLLGMIAIYRQEVKPFSDKQIALLQDFAAQAVIAIENARLLDEIRQRSAELARSVDELTATGDVLKIISRSSVDLATVLDKLVETVARLCRADQAYMFRQQDELHHLISAYGVSPVGEEFIRTHPSFVPERGTTSGRVALERRPVQIADVLQDPEYAQIEAQALAGFRTMLGIPLLREETLIGVLVVGRTRVEPFTSKEIEVVTSFADQAVIAIENARLFEELRDRQAELRVTFDNMGDGVAMFDGEPRLAAWNRNFQQILGLPDALLETRPTYADYLRLLAERGEFGTENVEAELASRLEDTDKELRLERTRPDGTVIEARRNAVPGGGFVLIYSDITERKRSEQAIRAARDIAETALRDLQKAQASLLHSQKMAALGQLAAGIAHEIKNPLNFVNNFAGLSVELLDELKEAMTPAVTQLDDGKRGEIDETIELLTSNLDKIASHGKRADGIVKSMLLHSRGGSGDRQSVDINAVLEEALNLAYHGARAQDQSFNVTLERELQADLAPIEIVPQDVTRVFLNLIGNGFYAVARRARQGDGSFRPILKVRTRELGEGVEIGIRDNGIGIRAEHRERLFQPFFTTKPTGEGTGLGLSISYDIVTQQHGGTITVDSELGRFTEFTVRLPRVGPAAAGRRPA